MKPTLATTPRLGTTQGIGIAVLAFIGVLAGLFLIQVVKDNFGLEERSITLGATFSKPYAQSLGLDWKKAYIATLDELQVRKLRIPAYWDQIEPSRGKFDYTDLDWQIDEASDRGAEIVLAVGRKLPRWPECHAPAWTNDLPESEVQALILAQIERTVRRYANETSIVTWQVENEPFFDFGECPPLDKAFLKREVATVRALDPRPIMITESGELSTWLGAAGIADTLGISTYRTVWSKYIGYFYWPIAPAYYARRFESVSTLFSNVIVSELQAEPWSPEGITSMPIDAQLRTMNPARLEENVRFARRIGFPEAYLWGVEWWYWLKETHERPELWEKGASLYAEANGQAVAK